MDEKVFNLLEKMYVEFSEFKQETKESFKEMNTRMTKIENNLENDFKPKIEVLFDGYKQSTKLLEDIRDEVAKHEEVILKRVK